MVSRASERCLLPKSYPKPEYRYPHRTMDLTVAIGDEIALEGLDGITLQALFLRLSRRPSFNMAIDEYSKSYLWNIAKRLKHILIYIMEEERRELYIDDRRDYIDERGNMCEPVNAADDIYEYFPIDDRNNGIRGSCKHYYTRRPYKSVAMQLSHSKITELYGNKVILVAPQHYRERVMLSDDSDVDLKDLNIIQYCILERVARSRYLGESTRGKVSLGTLKIDAKSLFYQRKMMLKKGIITKQSLSMKFGPNRTSSGVSIIHIPRFYTHYETVLNIAISKTISNIMDTVEERREAARIKQEIGKHMFRTLLSPDCSKIFQEIEVAFSEISKEEYLNETSPDKRNKMEKRTVKFVKLRDPRINTINFVKLLPKPGDDKDEHEDVVCATIPARQFSPQYSTLFNIIRQLFESKAVGASLNEVREKNSLTALDARGALRLLTRYGITTSVVVDKKKTKMHRYIYFKFKEANRSLEFQRMLTGQFHQEVLPLDNRYLLEFDLGAESMYLPSEIVWDIADFGVKTIIQKKEPVEEELPQIRIKHPAQILDDENIPKRTQEDLVGLKSTILALNPKVLALIQAFRCSFVKDIDEIPFETDLTDLYFAKDGANDFIPLDGDEARSLLYVTDNDWTVGVEEMEVRNHFGNVASFYSPKLTVRGNIILDLVYRNKVVLGMIQVIRNIRCYESSRYNEQSPGVEIDRRTVFRMLRQLRISEMIRIFRITLRKNDVLKCCFIFTPYCVPIESKLITSTVDVIAVMLTSKSKLSNEEKRANVLRGRLQNPKHMKGTRINKKKHGDNGDINPLLVKSAIPAGNKIVRRIVKGTRLPGRSFLRAHTDPEKRRYYDDKDKLALARLKRARVKWSPIEDRFIVCAFLASVLFIPRYNHQKIFMFNSIQIRDILHRKVEKGKSKTAASIRRRLHFLMKRTVVYGRYRYYLTEALADPVLKLKYLKKLGKRSQRKMFFRIPSKELMEVIEYLKNKFQELNFDACNATDRLNLTVPEFEVPIPMDPEASDYEVDATEEHLDVRANMEEFIQHKSKNKCSKPTMRYILQQQSTYSVVDGRRTLGDGTSIDVWTARTAILSLILSGDEPSSVHRFLSPISDEVLTYTIDSLRNIGLTSWNKRHYRFVPSLLLKRRINVHLAPDNYEDGYIAIQGLLQSSKIISPHPSMIGLMGVIGGLMCKCAVSFKIQIPDPVITINPEWQALFHSILDAAIDRSAEIDETVEDVVDAEDDESVNLGEKRKLKEPISQKSTKKTKLSNRSQIKIEFQAKNSIESVTLGAIGDVVNTQQKLYEALKLGQTFGPSCQSFRTSSKAIRIIRTQINSFESANFVQRDFFDVNLPAIEVVPKLELLGNLLEDEFKPKMELEAVKAHLLKVVFKTNNRIVQNKKETRIPRPTGMGKWSQLYDCILSTREIGISIQFLQTIFTRQTLSEGLRFLIRKEVIFVVGVSWRKVVSIEFIRKWTMSVPERNDASKFKAVIWRPWLTSTGVINWPVVDQYLTAILGYIHTHPEIKIDALCDRFTPVLSAVETMVLVDLLSALKFFNFYEIGAQVTPTLTSPPSMVTKNYDIDELLDLENLCIELHVLAVCKYSYVQKLFSSDPEHESERTLVRKKHLWIIPD